MTISHIWKWQQGFWEHCLPFLLQSSSTTWILCPGRWLFTVASLTQSNTPGRLFSGYALVPNLTNKERILTCPLDLQALFRRDRAVDLYAADRTALTPTERECEMESDEIPRSPAVLIGCRGARRPGLTVCEAFWRSQSFNFSQMNYTHLLPHRWINLKRGVWIWSR